jgi:hypothetical protein
MAEPVSGYVKRCVLNGIVKIDHLLSFHKEGKWII